MIAFLRRVRRLLWVASLAAVTTLVDNPDAVTSALAGWTIV